MSRHPWMPFYVDDFRIDTLDLAPDEVGVYFTMICLAWHRGDGSVPADIVQLKTMLQRSIAHFHGHMFNRIVPKLLERYFHLENGFWYQKRVVNELQKADKLSAKQSQNANKRWSEVRKNNKLADATAMPLQHNTIHKKEVPAPDGASDVVGEEPKARLFRLGKTILVSFGVAEKRTGALIGQWLKTRNDPVGLLAAIQFAREQNVAEPVSYISAVIAKGKSNGIQKPNLCDLASELADEARQLEREAGIYRPPDPFGSH